MSVIPEAEAPKPRKYVTPDPRREPVEALIDYLQAHGANVPPPDGRAWIPMRCPFHDDGHKSAQISYDTARFGCFACEIHGNLAVVRRKVDEQQAQVTSDAQQAWAWAERNTKWINKYAGVLPQWRGLAPKSDVSDYAEEYKSQAWLACFDVVAKHWSRWRAEGATDDEIDQRTKREIKNILLDPRNAAQVRAPGAKGQGGLRQVPLAMDFEDLERSRPELSDRPLAPVPKTTRRSKRRSQAPQSRYFCKRCRADVVRPPKNPQTNRRPVAPTFCPDCAAWNSQEHHAVREALKDWLGAHAITPGDRFGPNPRWFENGFEFYTGRRPGDDAPVETEHSSDREATPDLASEEVRDAHTFMTEKPGQRLAGQPNDRDAISDASRPMKTLRGGAGWGDPTADAALRNVAYAREGAPTSWDPATVWIAIWPGDPDDGKRFVALLEDGATIAQAAADIGMSYSTARRRCRAFREHPDVKLHVKPGRGYSTDSGNWCTVQVPVRNWNSDAP